MSAIEKGLCQCGCGQRTPIAGQTRGDRGQRKGEPVDFVNGAHGRRAAARELGDRFWEKVQKADGDGCWLFTSNLNRDGYGAIKIGSRNVGAHRVSWELTYGAVPRGLDVLHRCDTPACVRPDHLFVGTHQENMADMIAKGRKNPARGSRNGRAKLTTDDVRAIRASTARGKELSTQYGVSATVIGQIRRGKLWRSLGEVA